MESPSRRPAADGWMDGWMEGCIRSDDREGRACLCRVAVRSCVIVTHRPTADTDRQTETDKQTDRMVHGPWREKMGRNRMAGTQARRPEDRLSPGDELLSASNGDTLCPGHGHRKVAGSWPSFKSLKFAASWPLVQQPLSLCLAAAAGVWHGPVERGQAARGWLARALRQCRA